MLRISIDMLAVKEPSTARPCRPNREFVSRSQPWRKIWRCHGYVLLPFFVALLICGWFVTWGDGHFFEHDALSSFYDAQALSIIAGHLDVPREAIGFEAYIFQGKAYGYFGIAPALLRIPLLIIFTQFDGLWGRAMMMVACTVALVSVYRILLLIRSRAEPDTGFQRVLYSLFILCAALGSTNIFIVARSYVFHEAIMWGTTFALLFAWTLLKYLQSPSLRLLALSGAFAFMSFHSRATAGAGALLAICVLTIILLWRAWKTPNAAEYTLAFRVVAKPFPHALMAALAVTLTASTYFGINYAKFRTFRSMPLQYYDLYVQTPGRMQITGAKQIHFENIPTTLATYFGPRGLQFDREFPWVALSRQGTIVGAPAIDVVEPFSSFPVSMPALTLLALGGGVLLFRGSTEAIRRTRLPAVALLIGGGVVFLTVGITQRYLHDLYPALVICAAVGIFAVPSKKYRPMQTALFSAFALISVWLNCSFALLNQRAAPWGVPEVKRAEFRRFQQSINGLFDRKP